MKKENGLKLILNRFTTLYFQVRGTLDIRSLAVMDNQMKVNRIKNFLGKSIRHVLLILNTKTIKKIIMFKELLRCAPQNGY